MLCQQCHIILRNSAKFCTNCGSKQESTSLPHPDQFASLSLFPLEWYREFLECTDDARLDLLEEILKTLNRESPTTLYAPSARALFIQSMNMLCLPRRSFGDNAPKNFDNAKKYITSENRVEKEEGLELFKDMTINRELGTNSLIGEWYLFAKASVYGTVQIIQKEWDEKWKNNDASWEEIWNLAVSYTRLLDFGQALIVLRPGIDSKEAPFTHLRFALYCALQHLVHSSDMSKATTDFLRLHLHKWPQAECYLAWLLLKTQQTSLTEMTNHIEQTAISKTLYNLLTQPASIPELENMPTKKVLQDFVEQLEKLDFTETLILWLSEYTKHYCAKFGRRASPTSRFKRTDFEIWQKLGMAYERVGNGKRAEQIFYNLACEQQKIFLRQRKGNGDVSSDAFSPMRERLTVLFEFYQQHQMLQEDQVFDKFVKFYENATELWEARENQNKILIALTQSLLKRLVSSKPETETDSRPKETVPPPSSYPNNPDLSIPTQPELGNCVGIFIDLENIAHVLHSAKTENVGMALIEYASQFGKVACRWTAADLRNLEENRPFLTQLKRSGFQARHPLGEPQTGKADKSAADFALIEAIHSEKWRIKPNIYIIVSGDKDFYECINTLIDSGATVHLCASLSKNHIAEKYKRLRDEHYRTRNEQGLKSNFFIDDLDCILHEHPATR